MSEAPIFRPGDILTMLARADVKFVVIGGLAAQAHGSPSATFALDIVPSWDLNNLRAVASLLTDLAAVGRDLPADAPPMPPLDARTLMAGAVFTLNTRYGRFDLLANPDPGLDFETLAQTADRRSLSGVELLVASLDDLIAMKRAAGRPKDRVEVEILGALREELDRGT